MLHVKISGHGREVQGLIKSIQQGLIKSIQPSAILWPHWNWGGLAWERSIVLLQGPTGGCSPREISFAVPQCFSLVHPATSLRQLAQTMHQPVELRWYHLVLRFGAGRVGQGRDQHAVDKARGQLPTKHPGAYFIVYFVEFICWELKRIALKIITQEETSSFGDNLLGFCWLSADSGLALCCQTCMIFFSVCGVTKGYCHRYGNK